MYCCYYQVHVRQTDCWMFVAVLRSFEHLAFDRTLDKVHSIFELFVPEPNEPVFLELMSHFERLGVISALTKLNNRLLDPHQTV